MEVELSEWSTKATMVKRGEQRGEDVNIEDAEILVGGGRGLGEADNFKLAEELASALAERSRRPAPWSTPVGTRTRPRSGRRARRWRRSSTWRPGSPGAIQHKVGMQSSENILAINKDPNAPIFEFCDSAWWATCTRSCRS